MPGIVEGLARFLGRVEILALGLDDRRRAAEAALGRGRALEAREHARSILREVPDSLVGLALWADAAEDAWLDHEAVTALSDLARRVPFRADVWLRLGRAGLRTGWEGAREALDRAAATAEDRDTAQAALLALCDLDLAAGDVARAAHWVERIPVSLEGEGSAVWLRRAECAWLSGDLDRAAEAGAKLGELSPLDGRSALLRSRLAAAAHPGGAGATRAASPQPPEEEARPQGSTGGAAPNAAEHALEGAIDLAIRAFVLDTPGAQEFLAQLVGRLGSAELVGRVRSVVEGAGAANDPAWIAAFAFAEGRRDDARTALTRAVRGGDRGVVHTLIRLATEARDREALQAAAAAAPSELSTDLTKILAAAEDAEAGRVGSALDALSGVGAEAGAWAADLAGEAVRAWIPAPIAAPNAPIVVPEASWPEVLRELRGAARALDDMDSLRGLEALAVERERPLRVAIVGEFNAGKSSFINALLGEDVAPTGVLPTTATLHWVAWAPDAFARIVVRDMPDRVVPHQALKATLKGLAGAAHKVDRVFIYAPIERLKRIEILDTPGFNAPDPDHLASARRALDEAHLAIWLFDATMPLKDSERRVLLEARDLGVPVQILANKVDRLTPEALEKVLEHIRGGLAEAGLTSHAPPVAFSARLALAGAKGDAEALAASRWSEVEALLTEQIVDRSGTIRELALRRRALRIAGELAKRMAERAATERDQARIARVTAERTRAMAVRLFAERYALAEALHKALAEARKKLATDVRPVAALMAERRSVGAGASGSRAYVEERFVARLAAPIVEELRKIAWSENETAPSLEGPSLAVRAVLFGAVAAHTAPLTLAEEGLMPVLQAAVAAFATSLGEAAIVPPAPAPHAGLLLRTDALRGALALGAEGGGAPHDGGHGARETEVAEDS